ncbi:MAG: SRPBCC family protein [Actinomycetota bacterium]
MDIVKNASVSRQIAADPLTVWAAVADITRMGEWSPECHTCEWQEGHSEAIVGARFDGHNRAANGLEWSTHAEISAAEPGVSFHFKALFGETDFHFANWHYDFEPTDGGTRVTQSWEDMRPDEFLNHDTDPDGVSDRAAHNVANMEATLARLAAVVEAEV